MFRNVFSCILVLSSLLVVSQTVPIEISKTIEVVDGQKYHVHVVKKKETLYSICKAYNTTEQDLKSANPGALISGITEGQKLLIPAQNATSAGNKIHVVQKGETLYGISKQYNISIGELVQANPDARSGISLGQELIIPAAANPAVTTTTPPAQMAEERTTTTKLPVQSHTVLTGETIYSICKKYGIEQDVLIARNPSIKDGLKVGQVLQVESQGEVPQVTQAQVTMPEPKLHTVMQGETVYSIARMYNVHPNTLLEVNPSVQSGLSPGMKIRIPGPSQTQPSQATQVQPAQVKKDATIIEHMIEAGETLYAIARLNGCTTADIEELNPGINFSHVAVGTVIKVPSMTVKPSSTQDVTTSDTAKEQPIAKSRTFCDSVASANKHRVANIAYILPFYQSANDTIHSLDASLKRDGRLYGKSIPFVEFYEGTLLALDSLKRSGISVNIHTFDSDEDTSAIDRILISLSTLNLDLIIGPPAQEQFEKVAKFAQEKGIPVVSPLSTNTLLASTYNTAILANTPQKCRIQAEALFSMTDKTDIANYVIIFNGHVNEYDHIDKIKQTMLPFFADEKELDAKVKVVKYGLNAMQHIEDALIDSGKNVLIIPSEDQAFINDIVTRLYRFSKKYVIELHGMAVWETYKNIELDYLFDFSFHFVSSNFRDYTSPKVKAFVKEYRSSFSSEPSKLSFQGYDITCYFASRAAMYGRNLLGCTMADSYNGLQTSFNFAQLFSGSGLVNTHVNVIGYTPDYKRVVVPFDYPGKQMQYESLMKSKGLLQHIDVKQEQVDEEQE